MSKPTISTLNQKFDDFVLYTKEKLESIEKEAKNTNGKVAEAQLKIAKLQTEQETCPAKKKCEKLEEEMRKENRIQDNNAKHWVQWIIMTIIAISSILVAIFL